MSTRPTPDEADAALPGGLGWLPAVLGGGRDGIKSITDGLAVLPRIAELMEEMVEKVSRLDEVATSLKTIEAKTVHMDAEVEAMHAAVERIGSEMGALERSIREPLEDLTKTLHPMRRMTGRLGRKGEAVDLDGEIAEPLPEPAE